MVLFDLPMTNNTHLRNYNRFRGGLLDEGFVMMQESVYVRHAGPVERMEVIIRHVQTILPPVGKVSILHFTDKQWSQMRHFYGPDPDTGPGTGPQPGDQLLIF